MKRYTEGLRVPLFLSLVLLAGCAGAPAPVVVSAPAPAPAQEVAETPVEVTGDAEERYAAALNLLRRERYEQAGAALNAIIRDYPDLAGPYLNLGIVYTRLDRAAEAEQAVRAAIERNPDSAIAHDLLGVLRREAGRFEEARRYYERALVLDPSYAQAHLNLGILFDLYLQEPQAALEQYEQYRQLTVEGAEQVDMWITDLKHRLSGQTGQGPGS